jgi:hypothetical protein
VNDLNSGSSSSENSRFVGQDRRANETEKTRKERGKEVFREFRQNIIIKERQEAKGWKK